MTTAAENTAYRLPPGPRTPKLLNGIAFLVARNAFVRRLTARYGDALTIQMPGFGTMVLVTRPDLVKQVYTAKADVLHGGKNPLGEVLGPGSLFSMDEGAHLRERRMLLPPFHGERMRSYEAIIEEEALRGMAGWTDDVEFASIESFQTITLRMHPAHGLRRRGPRARRTGKAAAADDDDRPETGTALVPAPRVGPDTPAPAGTACTPATAGSPTPWSTSTWPTRTSRSGSTSWR